MPYTTAGKDLMLNALRASALYMSLHTADPGSTGANENTGGTPAYARKAITWAASSGANVDMTNTPVFDVASGRTITHIGIWSALTAGTFYGYAQLASSVTFSAQGTLTVTDFDMDLLAA